MDVTSFILEPIDGMPLEFFLAGQHLPVKLDIPGRDEPVLRSCSLSNGPGGEHYRISVKREELGLASRFLHDELRAGDRLTTGTPAGDFTMTAGSSRPKVLLSAGVGVTPMVSMHHALVREGQRKRVIFLHGARNGNQHALADEVRCLAVHRSHVSVAVHFSQPDPGETSRGTKHIGKDASMAQPWMPI